MMKVRRLFSEIMPAWFLERVFGLIIKNFTYATPLPHVQRVFNLVIFIFQPYLVRIFSAQAARFLSNKLVSVDHKDFTRLFLRSKLMTRYLRQSLVTMNWRQMEDFLRRNCSVASDGDQQGQAELLLCTHSGDYWISILMAAQQYQHTGVHFVVPIFEPITEETQAMYDRIDIPGVKITFFNIHQLGMLMKVRRYMKDPHCIVAIFYDLYCYSCGVFNGSVEPVLLFAKKGHMTTGIIQMAQRMAQKVSFVSCHYLDDEKKYRVVITPSVQLSQAYDIGQEMIRFLENTLRQAPWQWQFIALLDTYYHPPFSELQAWHTRNYTQFNRLNRKYSGHST